LKTASLKTGTDLSPKHSVLNFNTYDTGAGAEGGGGESINLISSDEIRHPYRIALYSIRPYNYTEFPDWSL
jgi:hypothetical protein